MNTMKKNKIKLPVEAWAFIIVVGILVFLMGWGIITSYMRGQLPWETIQKPVYSFVIDTSSEVNFTWGNGNVEGTQVYLIYTKEQDGSLTMMQIDALGTRLILDEKYNSSPHVVFKHKNGRIKDVVFYLPQNSVAKIIDGNLK